MIPYRPIAPLTVGPRRGWRSVLAAVVMAAVLGTTATSAVAAQSTEVSAAAAQSVATERSGTSLSAPAADPDGSASA